MEKKYKFISITLEGTWEAHERNRGGFRLAYVCDYLSPFGVGWGTLTFFVDNDGVLRCDDERMERDFVDQALLAFAQSARYDD